MVGQHKRRRAAKQRMPQSHQTTSTTQMPSLVLASPQPNSGILILPSLSRDPTLVQVMQENVSNPSLVVRRCYKPKTKGYPRKIQKLLSSKTARGSVLRKEAGKTTMDSRSSRKGKYSDIPYISCRSGRGLKLFDRSLSRSRSHQSYPSSWQLVEDSQDKTEKINDSKDSLDEIANCTRLNCKTYDYHLNSPSKKDTACQCILKQSDEKAIHIPSKRMRSRTCKLKKLKQLVSKHFVSMVAQQTQTSFKSNLHGMVSSLGSYSLQQGRAHSGEEDKQIHKYHNYGGYSPSDTSVENSKDHLSRIEKISKPPQRKLYRPVKKGLGIAFGRSSRKCMFDDNVRTPPWSLQLANFREIANYEAKLANCDCCSKICKSGKCRCEDDDYDNNDIGNYSEDDDAKSKTVKNQGSPHNQQLTGDRSKESQDDHYEDNARYPGKVEEDESFNEGDTIEEDSMVDKNGHLKYEDSGKVKKWRNVGFCPDVACIRRCQRCHKIEMENENEYFDTERHGEPVRITTGLCKCCQCSDTTNFNESKRKNRGFCPDDKCNRKCEPCREVMTQTSTTEATPSHPSKRSSVSSLLLSTNSTSNISKKVKTSSKKGHTQPSQDNRSSNSPKSAVKDQNLSLNSLNSRQKKSETNSNNKSRRSLDNQVTNSPNTSKTNQSRDKSPRRPSINSSSPKSAVKDQNLSLDSLNSRKKKSETNSTNKSRRSLDNQVTNSPNASKTNQSRDRSPKRPSINSSSPKSAVKDQNLSLDSLNGRKKKTETNSTNKSRRSLDNQVTNSPNASKTYQSRDRSPKRLSINSTIIEENPVNECPQRLECIKSRQRDKMKNETKTRSDYKSANSRTILKESNQNNAETSERRKSYRKDSWDEQNLNGDSTTNSRVSTTDGNDEIPVHVQSYSNEDIKRNVPEKNNCGDSNCYRQCGKCVEAVTQTGETYNQDRKPEQACQCIEAVTQTSNVDLCPYCKRCGLNKQYRRPSKSRRRNSGVEAGIYNGNYPRGAKYHQSSPLKTHENDSRRSSVDCRHKHCDTQCFFNAHQNFCPNTMCIPPHANYCNGGCRTSIKFCNHIPSVEQDGSNCDLRHIIDILQKAVTGLEMQQQNKGQIPPREGMDGGRDVPLSNEESYENFSGYDRMPPFPNSNFTPTQNETGNPYSLNGPYFEEVHSPQSPRTEHPVHNHQRKQYQDLNYEGPFTNYPDPSINRKKPKDHLPDKSLNNTNGYPKTPNPTYVDSNAKHQSATHRGHHNKDKISHSAKTNFQSGNPENQDRRSSHPQASQMLPYSEAMHSVQGNQRLSLRSHRINNSNAKEGSQDFYHKELEESLLKFQFRNRDQDFNSLPERKKFKTSERLNEPEHEICLDDNCPKRIRHARHHGSSKPSYGNSTMRNRAYSENETEFFSNNYKNKKQDSMKYFQSRDDDYQRNDYLPQIKKTFPKLSKLYSPSDHYRIGFTDLHVPLNTRFRKSSGQSDAVLDSIDNQNRTRRINLSNCEKYIYKPAMIHGRWAQVKSVTQLKPSMVSLKKCGFQKKQQICSCNETSHNRNNVVQNQGKKKINEESTLCSNPSIHAICPQPRTKHSIGNPNNDRFLIDEQFCLSNEPSNHELEEPIYLKCNCRNNEIISPVDSRLKPSYSYVALPILSSYDKHILRDFAKGKEVSRESSEVPYTVPESNCKDIGKESKDACSDEQMEFNYSHCNPPAVTTEKCSIDFVNKAPSSFSTRCPCCGEMVISSKKNRAAEPRLSKVRFACTNKPGEENEEARNVERNPPTNVMPCCGEPEKEKRDSNKNAERKSSKNLFSCCEKPKKEKNEVESKRPRKEKADSPEEIKPKTSRNLFPCCKNPKKEKKQLDKDVEPKTSRNLFACCQKPKKEKEDVSKEIEPKSKKEKRQFDKDVEPKKSRNLFACCQKPKKQKEDVPKEIEPKSKKEKRQFDKDVEPKKSRNLFACCQKPKKQKEDVSKEIEPKSKKEKRQVDKDDGPKTSRNLFACCQKPKKEKEDASKEFEPKKTKKEKEKVDKDVEPKTSRNLFAGSKKPNKEKEDIAEDVKPKTSRNLFACCKKPKRENKRNELKPVKNEENTETELSKNQKRSKSDLSSREVNGETPSMEVMKKPSKWEMENEKPEPPPKPKRERPLDKSQTKSRCSLLSCLGPKKEKRHKKLSDDEIARSMDNDIEVKVLFPCNCRFNKSSSSDEETVKCYNPMTQYLTRDEHQNYVICDKKASAPVCSWCRPQTRSVETSTSICTSTSCDCESTESSDEDCPCSHENHFYFLFDDQNLNDCKPQKGQ